MCYACRILDDRDFSWDDPAAVQYARNSKNHPLFDPQAIHDYVNQTKIWIDASRVEHRIKDMDKDYLFNVAAWINGKFEAIDFTLNFIDGEINGGYKFRTIYDTPLYKKIISRYTEVAGITTEK